MEEKWLRRFDEMLRFRNVFGHCNVPYKYTKNKPLGKWVQCQRTKFSQGSLSLHRVRKLEGVGFNWIIGKRRSSWEQRYAELAQFYKDHEHTNVQLGSRNQHSLAVWISCQRQNYRKQLQGQHTSLTAKRVLALEKLNFQWCVNEASWEQSYKELVQYMKSSGLNRVPRRCELHPKLSRWVATQRNQYSKARQGQASCLTPYRIQSLERIGFIWRETELESF